MAARTCAVILTLIALSSSMYTVTLTGVELSNSKTRVFDAANELTLWLLFYGFVGVAVNSTVLVAVVKNDQIMLKKAIGINWAYLAFLIVVGIMALYRCPQLTDLITTRALLKAFLVILACTICYGIYMMVLDAYYKELRWINLHPNPTRPRVSYLLLIAVFMNVIHFVLFYPKSIQNNNNGYMEEYIDKM